jgi:hypothetical protein
MRSAKTILENNILCLPVLSLPGYYRRQGYKAVFPESDTGKLQKIHLSVRAGERSGFQCREMSKKRKLEWQFFLNHRNRMTYNLLCRKCAYGCKQSFRAVVMDCPRYL